MRERPGHYNRASGLHFTLLQTMCVHVASLCLCSYVCVHAREWGVGRAVSFSLCTGSSSFPTVLAREQEGVSDLVGFMTKLSVHFIEKSGPDPDHP